MAVTSDLATDQRVHRNCLALMGMGYKVFLVGRRLPNSPDMSGRTYRFKRLQLLFTKGPLFYASFNLRLFFFLMSHRSHLIFANDLDTLFACWLAAKLKGKKLVYDSHEYFTGVPELEGRPFVRRIWKSIERMIVPRLETVITVNESIAELYRQEYHIPVTVIRNVPIAQGFTLDADHRAAIRAKLGVAASEHLLILQGSGINKDRGAEEAVQAMQYLQNTKLLILGGGDVLNDLKALVKSADIADKVIFMPRMPYLEMMQHTAACDLGLTLDKDTNINYRFSLPNKVFDYIQAGIPVLASKLVEVEKIVKGYDIGYVISSLDPKSMANAIQSALSDTETIALKRKNLQLAGSALTWENELKKFPKL